MTRTGLLFLIALTMVAAALLPQSGPATANPLTGVAAVAAGYDHTCALTTRGGVKCWGGNYAGQLGDGTTTDRRITPVDVVGLTDGVGAVAAGFSRTCVLTAAGGVKCWGYGQGGSSPVDVPGLVDGVAAITLGGDTCALTMAGDVKCWRGDSQPVDVVGLTDGVVAVAAGGGHTCALIAAGGVQCWGSNYFGELGDGQACGEYCTTPVDVIGLTNDVAAIAAGGGHTCALMTEGSVKCWGRNIGGQLGDSTTTDRSTPVDVTGLSSGVAALAAGYLHTCAVTAESGVKCWGWNAHGQLGAAVAERCVLLVSCSSTPVDVGLESSAASISTGDSHTCVVTTEGGAKCWGRNGRGQLGDGTACCGQGDEVFRSTPVDVVTKIAGGDADCNGAVNSVDALRILQFAAGLRSPLSCYEAADVNSDGSISAVDAAVILQYEAGLLNSLPV